MSKENYPSNGFYKIGGVVALILLGYVLATMVVVFTLGGQPETVQESFNLLHQNRLTGLLRLDVLTTLAMPLYYLLLLSLYAALKDSHELFAKISLVLGCAGVTLFLSAPSFLSWLMLSDKFAAATSDAQRNLFLAAGEALLATDMWHSSTSFVGGLLLQTATLLISIAMLGGKAFSRWTAWIGIITHGLDLAHIPLLLFIPTVGVMLMIVSGTLYLVWFPLLALDFFRLRKA